MVLSEAEVRVVRQELEAEPALVVGLLYVSGLRLLPTAKRHLENVHRLHQRDLEAEWGAVMLPHALASKYRSADRQWGWQWVFSQRNRSKDAATAKEGRHRLDPILVQKAVKQAVADTTMIYTHLL